MDSSLRTPRFWGKGNVKRSQRREGLDRHTGLIDFLGGVSCLARISLAIQAGGRVLNMNSAWEKVEWIEIGVDCVGKRTTEGLEHVWLLGCWSRRRWICCSRFAATGSARQRLDNWMSKTTAAAIDDTH